MSNTCLEMTRLVWMDRELRIRTVSQTVVPEGRRACLQVVGAKEEKSRRGFVHMGRS